MIVVTAPTGNIGSQVLAMLLQQREPVRVIVRNAARLSPEARARVEIVEGSHSYGAVVARAFEGADSVFWLVPGDMQAPSAEAAYVDFARPALEAFRRLNGKRVVSVSALGRGWTKDAGHVTATLKMDDMIAETGVHYRALACGSLMENILRQSASIKERGVFYWPSPAGLKNTAVATRDVAATASRFLLDKGWTGTGSIPLPGPEDISFGEMAEIMSDTLGKQVQFQEISMDDLYAMLTDRGASTGMAQAMVNMLTAKNEGMDNIDPRSENSGISTSFRQWCEEILKPAILAAE